MSSYVPSGRAAIPAFLRAAPQRAKADGNRRNGFPDRRKPVEPRNATRKRSVLAAEQDGPSHKQRADGADEPRHRRRRQSFNMRYRSCSHSRILYHNSISDGFRGYPAGRESANGLVRRWMRRRELRIDIVRRFRGIAVCGVSVSFRVGRRPVSCPGAKRNPQGAASAWHRRRRSL